MVNANADTYELYYIDGSHDHPFADGDFQYLNWDDEGCEISLVSEELTWDEMLSLADTTGLGIYLVSKNDANYNWAIRVCHGSRPDVRELSTK